MASSAGRDNLGLKEPGGPQSPTSVLVLRASHASVNIGSSDIRIWSELDSQTYECTLSLQSKRGPSDYRRGNVHTVVSFVPRIPLFGWLVLNVIIALRFRQTRFDLTVFTPRTWLAARILRLFGVSDKQIMDVRSGPTHRWTFLRGLELSELKVALAFSRTDGLTFINERTKDLSISGRTDGGPMGIWGSGVDLDLFRRSEEGQDALRRELGLEDAKVVMYHGTITKDRGVFQLVQAVEVLQEREAGTKLMILGWGPDLARLRREFRHLIRHDVLLLRGPVDYEKVPALLEVCDVGALPFPMDAKWESQMPLKLLEYLAMGKMVVATDMEAHRGFGKGVVLLPDNSPRTIAKELDRVFRIPEAEREKLIRDSLDHVRRLSWKEQARALQDFIRKVMMDQ